MRIEADLDRCVGAGQCVLTAPARFDQNDEDGRVVVLQAEVDEAGAEEVREAVTVCPSQALALVEQ
ncbi:ferredoxin [Saccharopolyspora antimicrobica]|uniref:Ferredoxin n=1 Tax=Saccharopolyspora antimicrobica TaxID=455193 RepID=A0A1I4QPP3_9PSEU|nr:ferredoxin [Saccharopolyspora antimicrobica]RKT88349.1 ferredoxin [Saccharopolyspora antimicrobica]SFM41979.1 ferredoxin [Saccharopolyspora antimicrobica]